ncbi:MAG: hypothetical protein ACE5JL_18230, partial [Dehalococcoidia bacterium]
ALLIETPDSSDLSERIGEPVEGPVLILPSGKDEGSKDAPVIVSFSNHELEEPCPEHVEGYNYV